LGTFLPPIDSFSKHEKYVVGNSLCPGDHIPWRRSLDGSDSRIQHMLMAIDAQLDQIDTPLGAVNFVQVCLSLRQNLFAADVSLYFWLCMCIFEFTYCS